MLRSVARDEPFHHRPQHAHRDRRADAPIRWRAAPEPTPVRARAHRRQPDRSSVEFVEAAEASSPPNRREGCGQQGIRPPVWQRAWLIRCRRGRCAAPVRHSPDWLTIASVDRHPQAKRSPCQASPARRRLPVSPLAQHGLRGAADRARNGRRRATASASAATSRPGAGSRRVTLPMPEKERRIGQRALERVGCRRAARPANAM